MGIENFVRHLPVLGGKLQFFKQKSCYFSLTSSGLACLQGLKFSTSMATATQYIILHDNILMFNTYLQLFTTTAKHRFPTTPLRTRGMWKEPHYQIMDAILFFSKRILDTEIPTLNISNNWLFAYVAAPALTKSINFERFKLQHIC